jgi:hypothetical protein
MIAFFRYPQNEFATSSAMVRASGVTLKPASPGRLKTGQL